MIINIPDIPYLDALSRKALNYCEIHLKSSTIHIVSAKIKGNPERFKDEIKLHVDSVQLNADRLLYISEIIQYLNRIKIETDISTFPNNPDPDRFKNLIDEIIFELHMKITEMGFPLSDDLFTNNELYNLSSGLDNIITKLNSLANQNDVIRDELQGLKESIIKSKYFTIFGKKFTRINLLGIIIQFCAEEGFKYIWPDLLALIKLSAGSTPIPGLLERIQNLLSS